MSRRTPAEAVKAMWTLLARVDNALIAYGYPALRLEQRQCALDTTRTTEAVGMVEDIFARVLTSATAATITDELLADIKSTLDDMNPEAAAIRALHELFAEAIGSGAGLGSDEMDAACRIIEGCGDYPLADEDYADTSEDERRAQINRQRSDDAVGPDPHDEERASWYFCTECNLQWTLDDGNGCDDDCENCGRTWTSFDSEDARDAAVLAHNGEGRS